MLYAVIALVALALVFDFLNGFHDAANSIATVVSTRVLTPGLAVLWAAFFNFIAVFILGVAVAKMVGKGIVVSEAVNNHVLFSALVGAISWNLLTCWLSLPTPTTHAMMGALIMATAFLKGTGTMIAPVPLIG